MRPALAALAMVAAIAATSAAAQLGVGPWRPTHGADIKPNVAYNGQFTFVRLRYGPPIPYQSQRVPWSHDYPTGEQHFMRIMNDVTNLKPRIMESNVMALDDPELTHYPVAYMSEPGYWFLTEGEATAFRAYLQKGGFVIFDDFAENRGGWDYFEQVFRQVIPGAKWLELDGMHPIFHSFFEIPDPLGFLPPYDQDLKPSYLGLYEDNDPGKRLMAIVNYNNDISEYWEYSGQGFAPVPDENEAYKLGVNYIIYGLTH
ncbi:MAG TPA: DUF4159 domain-containing protein [Vicinamibacterales bacterium]|nr:DUF4159 domain-containing protein [Vicinamibacterales bacterium]